MFPVYFGEWYYIGDVELRKQYELDRSKTDYEIEFKKGSKNPGSCNDMCSYWTGDQEEPAVKTSSTETVDGPKTRLASDTSDDGNGTGDREDADPVQQASDPVQQSLDPVQQASNPVQQQDAQPEFAGQAMGPLNIIAAAVPNEWSVACQMCSTCNRWYQTDGSCAGCSSDFDVILDESLYGSESDGSSYSGSSSDYSIRSTCPKRKRVARKYNVKNEKSKNVFKRNKK